MAEDTKNEQRAEAETTAVRGGLENRRREGPETFAELDPRVEDAAYIVMTWAR